MKSGVLDNQVHSKLFLEQDVLEDVSRLEISRCAKKEYQILNILKKYGYNFGVSLPCSKIKNLINLVEWEPDIQIIPVTREEEGIGICAGAYMAGKKPFMLIQSSGLGNSFNALASLIKTYKIPLLIVASYRGYHNETILAQIPLGKALPQMLDALGIPFIILRKGLEEFEKACKESIVHETSYVIFLSPELFEDV